jgi:phosphoribosylformylglycinamidine synthase
VLGIVGILEDVHKTARMEFREPGRTIVLLRATEPGDITDAESEFGSSEYAKEVLGAVWGYPPELDLEQEAALQRGLVEMIQTGLVETAHDCSSGGLAVTLAECAFPKGIGLRVDAASNGMQAEFALFGEDASRVVLACDRARLAGIQQVAGKHGLHVDILGETVSGQVEIKLDGQVVISAPIAELSEAYESALERALRTEPEAVAAD